MVKNQKITPFLWFQKGAEEAVKFYVDLFNGAPGSSGESKIGRIAKYDEAGSRASGQPEGSVMKVDFQLGGQDFAAINGGSYFKMSGAISFVINCDKQEEIDYFWEKLSEDGGEAGVCGWINHDKFGVTWQVTPVVLPKMIADEDTEKAKRVMEAMLKMKKIEIDKLEKAYKSNN